jgi:hypothetical protein
MCGISLSQISALSAVVGCMASPQIGYDPNTGTTASEERFRSNEIVYRIECPEGTESCLRRAEAICQGEFLLVSPRAKGPLIQVYLGGRIQTLNTTNPYLVRAACRAPTAESWPPGK